MREHDWHGAARPLQGRHSRARRGQNNIWGKRDQLRREFAIEVCIASSPADIDPHIFAFGPAKFLQALPEGRNASLSYRIIRCSRASFNSRASCAALVSLLAARELRPRAAFGASRRFNVLGRCVFAALPPVLSRRLIASPEAQDKAA